MTARQAPRLVRLLVGVPLIPLTPLSILPLFVLLTCGPALGARHGESLELRRVHALPLPSGGEAVVHRDNTGGATVAFSISVHHERPLGAGLLLSRRLYSQYGATSATLVVDARGDLLIHPDHGTTARHSLRRFVYF